MPLRNARPAEMLATHERRDHRVLLATDAYPPLIGGADRAVQLLACALRDRGQEVQVVTTWQRELPAFEDDHGIQVHRLRDLYSRMRFLSSSPHKHIPAPLPDPEAVWRFRRVLRAFRPNIVHSYGWITYSCAAGLLGSTVPLIVSARDYGQFCAVRTLLQNGRAHCSGPGVKKCLGCAGDFYGRPKAIVAVAGVLGGRAPLNHRIAGLHYNSAYMRTAMHRHFLGHGKTHDYPLPEAVIPTFRDEGKDEPADQTILRQLPDEPFILFVGALRRVKGVDMLMRAYSKLRKPPPLVLIGTREIDTPTAIPPGVMILESLPHGTVMAAWERALFGVFPSIWPEPFGNVVHEAMSRGRAAIGTVPGGHADIIDDRENGLLVEAGNEDQLIVGMQLLIDDSDLRVRLGRAAREKARKFTAPEPVTEFLELYDAVTSEAVSFRARTEPVETCP